MSDYIVTHTHKYFEFTVEYSCPTHASLELLPSDTLGNCTWFSMTNSRRIKRREVRWEYKGSKHPREWIENSKVLLDAILTPGVQVMDRKNWIIIYKKTTHFFRSNKSTFLYTQKKKIRTFLNTQNSAKIWVCLIWIFF